MAFATRPSRRFVLTYPPRICFESGGQFATEGLHDGANLCIGNTACWRQGSDEKEGFAVIYLTSKPRKDYRVGDGRSELLRGVGGVAG